MKDSTLATKVMIAILCLGVAVYLGFYLARGWDDPLVTTLAYSYAQDLGAEATGILIRRETVLSGSGGSYVDQVLNEGEKAAAGQTVALLYSDPSALTTRQSIRTLNAEIDQLNYALSSGTQNTDASRLDAKVLASMVNLRALTAQGDLTGLEDSALELRTLVFKRDYTYGDTDAAGQLSQLIAGKRAQLDELTRSLSQVSRVVSAPASGVFSGSVDGWERVASPDILDSLTAQELSALLAQPGSADVDAVGKLITDSTWYFAALLDGTDTGLQAGRSYDLAFSGDYYGQIRMKLERISLENGQTLAIFSCRSHMADTTLLRVQTVDVITRQLEGIRVPRKALRVVTETVTDEDGNTSQVNRYGVFTVVRSQAEWQEVDVLYTNDNFYLIRPVDENSSTRLRAGDEVILNSSDIYDGKVVR